MICQPAWQLRDDHRLAFRIRMARRHVLDEDRLSATDILDRLPRHRLRQEADEVAGVTGRERHADLAVLLHAADAGAVAGARIDDDDRRLRRIDLRAGGRNDADQRVVHRPLQRAAVAHQLGLEVQHVRNLLGAVLQIDVAALSQDIEKQDGALPCVEPVFLNSAEVQASFASFNLLRFRARGFADAMRPVPAAGLTRIRRPIRRVASVRAHNA